MGMGGAGICHIQREGLRFLVPVGQEGESRSSQTEYWGVSLAGNRRAYYSGDGTDAPVVNPLFAFSFLESFLETLQDYLGDVTETALKDNFDIVYMVSSHLLPPSDGYPS